MRAIAALVVLTALLCPALDAMFVRPDLENVPVSRLVANLERLVSENPGDARLLFNLGRVHAMAYALKTDSAQVWRGREDEGVWTGYEPEHMQLEVKPPRDAAAEEAARVHLRRAIALYRQAVSFDDDSPVGHLSLGWALAQAGDKPAAIATLRKAAELAWKEDQKIPHLMHGWRSVTEEAVRYLIPLLDPEADAGEVKTLRDRVSRLERLPRAITPIAIPLRAGLDALDITDPTAMVRFDADGSGLARPWTWITPDAGWLVYDARGTGRISSALQMFGNVTFWAFWDHGYQALRALDDDGDGRLGGRELDGLAIWRDANRNGVSEPGEVRSPAFWGVVSISCAFEFDPSHPDEIAFSPRGVTFDDGTTRPTFDIVLHRRAGR